MAATKDTDVLMTEIPVFFGNITLIAQPIAKPFTDIAIPDH
jgi:hypothetical protein